MGEDDQITINDPDKPKVSNVLLTAGYVLLVFGLYILIAAVSATMGKCGTACADSYGPVIAFFAWIITLIFLIPSYLILKKTDLSRKLFFALLVISLVIGIINGTIRTY